MSPSAARPRVLLFTSGPVDGQEGADIQLAATMAEVMPDVEFLSFTGRPERLQQARTVPGRRIPILTTNGLPGALERLEVTAATAALAHRVDLVHAVLTIGPAFPVLSRLPRLTGGRPVLHTVPGIMDSRLLRRSRPLGVTTALSGVTARELRAAGFGDVRVVPPMIWPDRWPARPRPAGPPVVLFAGHHDHGGGAEDAITAAAAAARAGARFRLVLAMRGRLGQDGRALRAALRERAEAEGLAGTRVHGYVADMPKLLAESSVVLFVPRTLGGKADIPFTVLEALATGRPVIMSDLPQFAPLGDAVLRVAPGDRCGTGDLLARLLESPRWWERTAEHGRAAVAARFGPDRFGARYRRIYRELLA